LALLAHEVALTLHLPAFIAGILGQVDASCWARRYDYYGSNLGCSQFEAEAINNEYNLCTNHTSGTMAFVIAILSLFELMCTSGVVERNAIYYPS
jgi:hypothetical protein